MTRRVLGPHHGRPLLRVERFGVEPFERDQLGLEEAFGQRPLAVGEAALPAGVGAGHGEHDLLAERGIETAAEVDRLKVTSASEQRHRRAGPSLGDGAGSAGL